MKLILGAPDLHGRGPVKIRGGGYTGRSIPPITGAWAHTCPPEYTSNVIGFRLSWRRHDT